MGLTLSTMLSVLGGLVLGFGIVFFLRSMDSRRWYVCTKCGERVKVELMDASHCNTCGAELQPEGV
jgi:rRNA maturation endonuclease Nob1